MPSPTWVEHQPRERAEPVQAHPFLQRLADAGVFNEADQIFDAEDAGLNPCDSVPIQDLLASAQEHRQ